MPVRTAEHAEAVGVRAPLLPFAFLPTGSQSHALGPCEAHRTSGRSKGVERWQRLRQTSFPSDHGRTPQASPVFTTAAFRHWIFVIGLSRWFFIARCGRSVLVARFWFCDFPLNIR